MSLYSSSSFPEDKKNLEFFNSQQQQPRFEGPPPAYQPSAGPSASSTSTNIPHGNINHFQSAAPVAMGSFVGPQAVPSPITLMIHFVKLGRGGFALGWGENLYSLSLAPISAPNHIIYEYMPDISKDSSSGSHRATLSALGQPIFHTHVSGDYSLSGPFSGEIIGIPLGPHSAFREAAKYKPFKKEEGVDKYNPTCSVSAGENTDIQVARFCARVLSSILNPNPLTGSKSIRPNKIAPTGSYSSDPNSIPGPAIDPNPTGVPSSQNSSTSKPTTTQSGGKKGGFLAALKQGLKQDDMSGLTEEEKKKKKKKKEEEEICAEVVGAIIGG